MTARIFLNEFTDEPGHWNFELAKNLTARGTLCPHCKQAQMRATTFVELRTLVQNGQLSREEMVVACEGYCLGHADEWIPECIIQEER